MGGSRRTRGRDNQRYIGRYKQVMPDMTTLAHLDTPAALVDVERMQANITRMQSRMDALGVALRPHVKTSKSWR